MSINSLTAVASNNATSVESIFLLTTASGANAYRASLKDVSHIGVGFDQGACWQCNTGAPGGLSTSPYYAFGSLAYDSASWTDANSIGIFRVPTDKWEYVQIGFNVKATFGSNALFWMSRGTAIDLSGAPYGHLDGTSSIGYYHAASEPIRVVSGQLIIPAQYAGTGVYVTGEDCYIWLRPYGKRKE